MQWSDTSRMITRFKRDVRLSDYLKSNYLTDDYETTRSHRKNKKWQSPRDIGPTEDCAKEFEENANKETRTRKHLKGSNLTTLQQTR